MNNAGYAGAFGTGLMRVEPHTVAGWRRAGGFAWGLVCGVTFVTARASIYLIALPFAALACLAGAALCAIQAAAGGSHG